jgi:hypothetical protein
MNNKEVYALDLHAKNRYSDFSHLYDVILKQCQVCYYHATQSVIHIAQHADLKKTRRITSKCNYNQGITIQQNFFKPAPTG